MEQDVGNLKHPVETLMIGLCAKFGLMSDFEALQFRNKAMYLTSNTNSESIDDGCYVLSRFGVVQSPISEKLGRLCPLPRNLCPEKCVESRYQLHSGPARKVYQRVNPELSLKRPLRHFTIPTPLLILQD